MNKQTDIKTETLASSMAQSREALLNIRRALLDGNWSLALGHAENALGIVGRKAA